MKLLLALIILLIPVEIWAQGTSTAAHIRYGSSLPSTCKPSTGDVFFKTTATIGAYQCLTTNTWTAMGGGGGGTPGGSNTQVQFNDSNSFGGNSGFTFDKTTGIVTIDATITINGSPSATLANGNIQLFTEFNPVVNQATGKQSIIQYLTVNGAVDVANVSGAAFAVDNYLTGTTGSMIGVDGITYVEAGTVGRAVGLEGDTSTYAGTTAQAVGVWGWIGAYSGTITNAYDFYAQRPSTGATVGSHFSYWSDDMSGLSGVGNSYYFWADDPGVFRIKSDNTFDSVYQAIPALYNPQFTKYTPGAANYERIVEQWNGNVAEIGTEKGGTGTQRSLRLLGAAYLLPSMAPGAATGKHVVCIDGTTHQLYESSTGTDCSN